MPSIDAIINRQFLRWERQTELTPTGKPMLEPLPVITVSRQKGSRGSYFAARLSERLGYQELNRGVIDAICESSGYRKRVVASLDQHVRSDLELTVEAILSGQAVDHSDYIRHLVKVILSTAKLGGVVVLGRGANHILGLNQGVHFRVVAPYESRVKFLIKYQRINQSEAMKEIEKADNERREFAQKLFGKNLDDPQYYDVVYNSALIDIEEMIDSALLAITTKLDKLKHLTTGKTDLTYLS